MPEMKNQQIAQQLLKIADDIQILSLIADGDEFETSIDLFELQRQLQNEASRLEGC